MQKQKIFSSFILTAILLAGCSTNSTRTVPSVAAVRTYNGTASVGGFLTISIDSTTATITYSDLSNGQSGTVPYTVGTNGTYTIADPQGNLLATYELPG
jgi:PBP1b-binding outer membrane lipoprotein LpoB